MLEEGREMETEFERTCQIERADGDSPGKVAGILVTDGEASDGDILDIDGGQLPKRAPLLFGHDDYSGTGNLGSWDKFSKVPTGTNKPLGGKAVRGEAQIETGGSGPQQEWRDDIAHMIEQKHIGMFSVRWSGIGDPIRRVNLPSDHVAFVDANTATGNKRWGLYFPKWKLLEGSVVTLGADPAALIGRMQQCEGDVRGFWRQAINHALTERVEHRAGLVAISTGAGVITVEREAYDSMLEGANARLNLAIDLFEELHEETLQLALGAEPLKKVDAERIISPGKEDDVPEKTEPTGDTRSVLEFDAGELEFPTAVDALAKSLLDALAESDERWDKGVQKLMGTHTGKLQND